MTTPLFYVQCTCGTFNPANAKVCGHCGILLRGGGQTAAPTATAPTATTAPDPQSFPAQAGYWNKVFGTGSAAPAPAVTPLNRVTHYCPACGVGMTRTMSRCPHCRHSTSLNVADVKVSVLVGTLVVSGFLLGVIWTSVLLNYLPLPNAPTVRRNVPTTTHKPVGASKHVPVAPRGSE